MKSRTFARRLHRLQAALALAAVATMCVAGIMVSEYCQGVERKIAAAKPATVQMPPVNLNQMWAAAR